MYSHSRLTTRFRSVCWAVLLPLALVSIGAQPSRVVAGEGKVRVAIIGDSTVASYPQPPADRPDLTGWGQVFGEFFDEQVLVLNHAKSGRSSKSFLSEGLWDKTLAEHPNYVLIQFGHNDCPGKGDRETNPATDFRDNLRRYIADARKIGAIPILVTPMTRRQFRDGQIYPILRPYAEAMLAVGGAEHVAVIDLHRASVELFNRLGDEGSAYFSPTHPIERTSPEKEPGNSLILSQTGSPEPTRSLVSIGGPLPTKLLMAPFQGQFSTSGGQN